MDDSGKHPVSENHQLIFVCILATEGLVIVLQISNNVRPLQHVFERRFWHFASIRPFDAWVSLIVQVCTI